jgi:hypothetical protein
MGIWDLAMALRLEVDVLFRFLILVGHLYLSGMWLGVPPRMDTKKAHV